jgi:hypothetical protein
MFQTKNCRESQNTHSLFSNFFPKNLAVFEITWKKNVVQPGTPQMALRRMGISCWVPQPTNTHSEYVTFIVFPLQR